MEIYDPTKTYMLQMVTDPEVWEWAIAREPDFQKACEMVEKINFGEMRPPTAFEITRQKETGTAGTWDAAPDHIKELVIELGYQQDDTGVQAVERDLIELRKTERKKLAMRKIRNLARKQVLQECRAESEETILYYARVDCGSDTAYKIGITMNTVESRYAGELDKVTVLKEWVHETRESALQAEETILLDHIEFMWCGRDLLEAGNTELFSKDVLGLDHPIY